MRRITGRIVSNGIYTPIAQSRGKGDLGMGVRRYKNRYEVAVPDGRYADGRMRYKRVVVDSREDAERLDYEFNGNPIPVVRTTFKDVATKWLKEKEQEVRYSTWNRYKGILSNHMFPYFENMPINEITADDVKEYFYQCKGSGSTLQQYYVILRGIFGLTKNKIMEEVKRPKNHGKEINCIKDPHELFEFVATFRDSVLFLPVYLAATTGMRLSEIAGLRWEDINFEKKTITVSRSLHWKTDNGEKTWYINPTKNKASNRTIRIGDKDAEILLANITAKKKDFVCLKQDGTPINKDSVSSNFRNRASVRGYDISFHSLRHSHATILLQYYKKSINAVSRRLGHAKETTTLMIYSSALPQEDDDIASTIDSLTVNF
jgi:integrase